MNQGELGPDTGSHRSLWSWRRYTGEIVHLPELLLCPQLPIQARARGKERMWWPGFPLGGMLTGPDCSTLWPRSVLPSSQAGGARGVGSQEPHIEKQLGEGPLRSRLSLHGSVFTLDVRRAGGRQAARLQTLLLQGTGAVPHAPSPPSLQCRTGSPHWEPGTGKETCSIPGPAPC